MVRVLYYYCLPHMHRVYIQHTALLLMILGLLVVVYIFSFYPCFFQLLLFALDDSGQKISTLYALARFPSPPKTPLCVHTSMSGSSLSSPDKDNACQLGPPGPWYSPITICCIDISATFDSISYVVAGSAVTYQSV